MKILLVGGLSNDAQDRDSLIKLRQYVQDILPDAQLWATHMDLLEFSLAPDSYDVYDISSGLDLKTMDQVIIRGPKMRMISEYAYYLSRFCQLNHIDFWNDYSGYYPGTKFAQNSVFYEHKAPFLQTLFSLDKAKMLERAQQMFGYPYILKTNVGSHGNSNYLIKSADEAQAVVAKEPDTKFIAQAYCPNDRDYRLLFVGDEHLVFERRGSADVHINNTSKGGVATAAHDVLPQELIDQAKTIGQSLGLTVSGADVMPRLNTDEYYFLEINSQPQFRTGALLDEKKELVRALLQKES